MASSVSLIFFMSYTINRAIDINNIELDFKSKNSETEERGSEAELKKQEANEILNTFQSRLNILQSDPIFQNNQTFMQITKNIEKDISALLNSYTNRKNYNSNSYKARLTIESTLLNKTNYTNNNYKSYIAYAANKNLY